MYTTVEQWTRDADYAPHLSVASQIGVDAFPQVIKAFKRDYGPYIERWKQGETFEVEEKVVLVQKLTRSSTHIGSQHLRNLSRPIGESLQMNPDMPIDPLLSHVDELLKKLGGIA